MVRINGLVSQQRLSNLTFAPRRANVFEQNALDA
jgi:hypothetical protein